ncbi:MAG TPA: dihydrofolate reductase [Mycobacteriales bacterium]|nr:dihydrofolate reductase [Mycobacteriales bacterium]
MTVSLIWAQSANGVIGHDGALPWRLPEDQQLFKQLTMGATVLMGRATWDSLPASVRPLPGRRNVVLTRAPSWSASGAEVAHSLEEALSAAAGEVWVIGGATVYAAALPLADRIVRTDIDALYDGDAHAPRLADDWQVVDRDPASGWHHSTTGLRYAVTTLARKGVPHSSSN